MGEEQLSSIRQQYNKYHIYNNKNNINIKDMNINKLFWNLAKSTRIIIYNNANKYDEDDK
jgi:hypothetical protein